MHPDVRAKVKTGMRIAVGEKIVTVRGIETQGGKSTYWVEWAPLRGITPIDEATMEEVFLTGRVLE